MSERSDATVYVGTVGEGLWRSSDGGATWDRKNAGMYIENEVRALAVHPSDPSLLYAGTDQGCYRSADGGDRWTQLDSELNELVIWSLLVMPDDPDTVLAGTRPAAVFRSSDGGDTWQRLAADMAQECPGIVYNRVTTLNLDPAAPDTIWAGVEIDGAWRSAAGIAAIPGPATRKGSPRWTSTGWRWCRERAARPRWWPPPTTTSTPAATRAGAGSRSRWTSDSRGATAADSGSNPATRSACTWATATARPARRARPGAPPTAAPVGSA